VVSNAPLQAQPFDVQRLGEKDLEAECVVVEDIDGDGHVDILGAVKVYDGVKGLAGSARMWWGRGDREFVQEDVPFPVGTTPTTGCTAVDVDGDGLLDVLMGTVEGNVAALLQTSPGKLEPYIDLVEVDESFDGQRFTVLVPYDLDGVPPLDLLVGTMASFGNLTCVGPAEDPGEGGDIWHEQYIRMEARIHCLQAKQGGYRVAAPGLCPASLRDAPRGPVWTAKVGDLDDDGRGDILFSGDYSENIALMSNGSIGLDLATEQAGIGVYNHAMGFALEDFDGDGMRDLYVSDTGPDQLWAGQGCGSFEDVSMESQVGPATDRGYGWGVAAFDLEQDGDIDIFVSNSVVVADEGWLAENFCQQNTLSDPPQTMFFLHNNGFGEFTNVEIPLQESYHFTRAPVSIAHGDLDNDGDVDVVAMENRQMTVYWNEAVRHGSWISIVARDAPLRPSLGARVAVRSKDGRLRWRDVYGAHGRDGHSELAAHFGLGASDGSVDVLIRWPDGKWTQNTDVQVNQRIVVQR
jgi:hypothetical protein